MNENSFICENCGKRVSLRAPGTHNRNHCPYCLYSLHLDNDPGDRRSVCRGKMAPVGKMYKKDGEEVVVHRCERCGFERRNRVAGDDDVEMVDKLPILL